MWAAGLSFRTYTAQFGVRVSDPCVLDSVNEHLPRASTVAVSPEVDALYSLIVGGSKGRIRRYNMLYIGSLRLARTMELSDVFQTLQSDLPLRVPLLARHRLFVRAGVVKWQGRAIVIPGNGDDSALLLDALVDAGASFFSDDYAVLDGRGRVHPFSPNESAKRKPLPLGLVAMAEYRRGARWKPQSASAGTALLGMLEHAPIARFRPEFAMDTLRQAVDGASVLAGAYGNPTKAASSLLEYAA